MAKPPGRAILNVLSVAVLAEDLLPAQTQPPKPEFLTERFKVDGFKDWSFGICRVRRPLEALYDTIRTYEARGGWQLSGQRLAVGELWPQASMFAPPDAATPHPINAILKNNFWAGSHVFRLADLEKTEFLPFFENRLRLQHLSDQVLAAIPIKLGSLADYLGDVVIQLPVLNFLPECSPDLSGAHTEFTSEWRPGAARRDLTVMARTEWDSLLPGAARGEMGQGPLRLPIDGYSFPLNVEMLDSERGHIVAAASVILVKQIRLSTSVEQHEPRTFSYPDADGNAALGRVQVATSTVSTIGAADQQDANYWLGRRNVMEERQRLARTREFVQYKPTAGVTTERVRALEDLRWLIQRHGGEGADLWDPYLSAEDILQTLFWCTEVNAPLRALTDGKDPPQVEGSQQAPFVGRQQITLQRDCGNRFGLKLEYRTRRGPKGWAFHDRFLIFPNGPAGPKAWSLGTSVNSAGRTHHILQRAANPELIAASFDELWSALDEPQHVVWQS